MTENLADVYKDNIGAFESMKHLYSGVILFSLGFIFLSVAILLATTNVLTGFGLNKWQHWEIAGVIGGIGFPLSLLGVIVVMPSRTRRTWMAIIGILLCIIGVIGFYVVFPHQWVGDPTNHSLSVTSVYSTGAIITLWCMFSGIIDFKTRNNPGGTVRLQVTRQGNTEYIEIDKEKIQNNLGSLGYFGTQPNGNIETQTNNKENTNQHEDRIPADRDFEWPTHDEHK